MKLLNGNAVINKGFNGDSICCYNESGVVRHVSKVEKYEANNTSHILLSWTPGEYQLSYGQLVNTIKTNFNFFLDNYIICSNLSLTGKDEYYFVNNISHFDDNGIVLFNCTRDSI